MTLTNRLYVMAAFGSTLLEHAMIGPDGLIECRELAEKLIIEAGEDPDEAVKVEIQIVGGMP